MNTIELSSVKASENQINKIKGLLEDDFLNPLEKTRISKLLKKDISKESASRILSYWLGIVEYANGSWKKISSGILEERKSGVQAA